MSAAVTTLCLLAAGAAPLTDRLGHRQYRERDRAHRALAAFGRVAIPVLERAQGHPCPEVRGRAARLLYPHVIELADRDARAMVTSILRDFQEWRAADGWANDVRFYRFYAEGHGPQGVLRLWIQSQLLQHRSRTEIRAELESLRAWRGDQ
jgi:hypothetical protein